MGDGTVGSTQSAPKASTLRLISLGILNSENPMRDVVLPQARPSGETYAYSLEEILREVMGTRLAREIVLEPRQ